jgi:hypothetical protein
MRMHAYKDVRLGYTPCEIHVYEIHVREKGLRERDIYEIHVPNMNIL